MLSNQSDFKQLLLLHGRDRRHQKLEAEIIRIPKDLLRLEDQIETERKSIEIALQEWRELETKNNSLESEIISIGDKISRLKQQQLAVKKNEEYTALENEINAFMEKQNAIEDLQLETLMLIDDARKVAEIAEDKISLKLEDLNERLNSLKKRSLELESEKTILEAEIEDARKCVEPDILSKYDRTKTVVKKAPYLAPVLDQKCTGCNLRVSNDVVSSILVERKITHCDQCGRIVYVER